jgi:hypothetical protein
MVDVDLESLGSSIQRLVFLVSEFILKQVQHKIKLAER